MRGRGQAEKLDTGPTLGIRIAEKLGKYKFKGDMGLVEKIHRMIMNL